MKSLRRQAEEAKRWRKTKRAKPSYFQTGSVALDTALNGGYLRGQITTIYFAAGSDPERLLLAALRTAQQRHQTIGIIATVMLDLELMRRADLNLSTINVARTIDLDGMERALRAAQRKSYDLLVIDTLDALLTKKDGLERWHEIQTLLQKMRTRYRSADTATLVMRMMNERGLKRGIPHAAKEDDRALVVLDDTRKSLKVRVANPRTDIAATEINLSIDEYGHVNLPRELKQAGFQKDEINVAREVYTSRDDYD
jgi:predicted ATP-dependent serine protease